MEITQQKIRSSRGPVIKKQRNLGEITEYFDAHWKVPLDPTLQRVRSLEKILQHPAQGLPAIVVAGTNGKSTTIQLAAKLLTHEGLRVGTFTTPHILLYKEQLALDLKAIPSKIFTEISNEVIGAAEELGVEAHTFELLLLVALIYFKQNNTDVIIVEMPEFNGISGEQHPINIVDMRVASITRLMPTDAETSEDQMLSVARSVGTFIRPGMYLVSGDQNKATLNVLQKITIDRGGIWGMPIRKLARLAYPFEQLHGRCAAIAGRIAAAFIEQHIDRIRINEATSLLLHTSGKRGRPTLANKREQELNPRKTIEQFWKETTCDLPCKFQILDKEKPTILLDTASNLDALKNVLLGIRLLHYQRPLKGLVLVMGASKNSIHGEEFLKLIRYFFKKTTGQIFICPPGIPVPGSSDSGSWDVEQVVNDIKSMKVKARACRSFEEAFEHAQKSVDERNGLLVITGSHGIVSSYFNHNGVKKLS